MLKRIISTVSAVAILFSASFSSGILNSLAVTEQLTLGWSKNAGGWNLSSGTDCTATSNSGWNKAYTTEKLSRDFTFKSDISYTSGTNCQYFIYFGAPTSGGNGYSLRIQLNDSAAANNICVYDDITNTRKARWIAFPTGSDKDNFSIKLELKDSVAKVYIDDSLVCTSDTLSTYQSGYLGLGTYKTAARFYNMSAEGEKASVTPPLEDGMNTPETDWKSLSNMSVSENSANSTIDNGWAKLSNGAALAADEDFYIETDVEYVSGNNHQYFLYFGLPSSTDLSGGFSVRLQLGSSAGNNNLCIYNDAENRRLCSWTKFPEASSKTSFKMKVEFKDNNTTLYIDGVAIAQAPIDGYSGGSVGFATFKTKANLKNIIFRTENKHSKPKVYIANEDFENFDISEHETSIKGNIQIIGSNSTSSKIITENGNKYLSMSRKDKTEAENCLLQFYDMALNTDSYVVQFDVKLDKEIVSKDKTNLLIGRKNVGGKGQFEYILNISETGYLYCTTAALGSTTLGKLSADKVTNVAVVINDADRSYSVYLDGVLATRNQSFTNDNYSGTPSQVQTMFRIALGARAKDNAVLVDNFKVYTGSEADGVIQSEKSIIENLDNDFKKLVFTDSQGSKLGYRLYVPENYNPNKKYPIVLAMHGAGLWGSDNASQLMNCTNLGVTLWHSKEDYESIIVVPQSQKNVSWVTGDGNYPWFNEGAEDNYDIESFEISRYLFAVTELLDSLCNEYSVDLNRQYVGGFSMGGYATWYLISMLPERFAAALPTCAGADPNYAKYIKDMPIWTFHSIDDETVSVESTRQLVEALRAEGSNVKYTEFSDYGHNVWDYAFQSKEVLDWMFSQTNNNYSDRNILEENIKWKTEQPEFITLTTTWIKGDNNYEAQSQGWNKATLDKKLDSGSFIFETDISEFIGEQLYVYFGLPDSAYTENGYSVRFQFSESAGSNNICVYKDNGNKRQCAWVPFPEGSSKEKFKLTVKMSGKLLTVLIDGKIALATEYLTEYSGGYMGVAANKGTAIFSNTKISVKDFTEGEIPSENPESTTALYKKDQLWNLISSNWKEIKSGYSSKGQSGWSKSGFATRLYNENFAFEADISDFTGDDRQLYLYFGLQSSYCLDDGYSLRIQFGDTAAGNNASVYSNTDKKRLARWVSWPSSVSQENFKLRLEYTDSRLMVYANDVLLLICDITGYTGGCCGIATNKSGADIRNVKLYTSIDRSNIPDEAYKKANVDLRYLTQSFEKIKLGIYPGNITGWNKAIGNTSLNGNFKFDTDIEYISGSLKQYYFYFGLPKADSLDNGYSVRIQLSEETGKNNIAVYRDADKKRMSPWVKFPTSSNRDKFHLTVKLSNGVAVVMIDSKTVCTTSILDGYTGGYYGLALNRTSGKVINMALGLEDTAYAISPVTGDNTLDTDFIVLGIISLLALLAVCSTAQKMFSIASKAKK